MKLLAVYLLLLFREFSSNSSVAARKPNEKSLQKRDCYPGTHVLCRNGGSCIRGVHGFHCLCRVGFTGDHCQTKVNHCEGIYCNGGTCIDGHHSFTCSCLPGYAGRFCRRNVDECRSSPCMNGGSCVDLVNRYRCYCHRGFTGVNCEINVDKCSSNPCVFGTCHERVHSYVCQCEPGFTGDHCTIKIKGCTGVVCHNGGTCFMHYIAGRNSYMCSCLPGFNGHHCEQRTGECTISPCLNDGVCVRKRNGLECKCPSGYQGEFCEAECPKILLGEFAYAHAKCGENGAEHSVEHALDPEHACRQKCLDYNRKCLAYEFEMSTKTSPHQPICTLHTSYPSPSSHRGRKCVYLWWECSEGPPVVPGIRRYDTIQQEYGMGENVQKYNVEKREEGTSGWDELWYWLARNYNRREE